jgi:hypothetical protein
VLVQALAQSHDGVDPVVGEVRSDHTPKVFEVVAAAVCHATILTIVVLEVATRRSICSG